MSAMTKAKAKCFSGLGACMSARSARRDMFVNAAGFAGNQTAIVIVTQLQHPIEFGGRPLPLRKKFIGIAAEGAQEFRDFAVMPADEEVLFMVPGGNVRGKLPKLAVFELIADLQMKSLAERFDGEAGAMTLFGVSRGIEGVEHKRFGVHAERLEIRDISLGALTSGGRQIRPGVWLLSVAYNENDRVFRRAKVSNGIASECGRFGETGDRNAQCQQPGG